MSYIGDLAELRLAAAQHYSSLGGHAHLNCTLCQVAIRERVRQEQLARRLPYEQEALLCSGLCASLVPQFSRLHFAHT
eukprot:COSAG02_NODE_7769_length_2855_cov_3.173440_3_plen_78_part_00